MAPSTGPARWFDYVRNRINDLSIPRPIPDHTVPELLDSVAKHARDILITLVYDVDPEVCEYNRPLFYVTTRQDLDIVWRAWEDDDWLMVSVFRDDLASATFFTADPDNTFGYDSAVVFGNRYDVAKAIAKQLRRIFRGESDELPEVLPMQNDDSEDENARTLVQVFYKHHPE